MDHHLRSTPGNVHWGLWDGRLKPVLRIASGDRVTIETLSGEPDDVPDPSLGFSVVPGPKEVLESTFRGPGPHLLTGPIHIEGAEPGDVIEVRVLDLQLRAD
jgi:acetamidase/formamidase